MVNVTTPCCIAPYCKEPAYYNGTGYIKCADIENAKWCYTHYNKEKKYITEEEMSKDYYTKKKPFLCSGWFSSENR